MCAYYTQAIIVRVWDFFIKLQIDKSYIIVLISLQSAIDMNESISCFLICLCLSHSICLSPQCEREV